MFIIYLTPGAGEFEGGHVTFSANRRGGYVTFFVRGGGGQVTFFYTGQEVFSILCTYIISYGFNTMVSE